MAIDGFTFYVAGPWDHKAEVYAEIKKLRAAGWQTNSRWAEPENPDVAPDDPERNAKLRAQALRDVEDVMRADGLFYINSKYSEGKATELGLSIATLKPIVVVGGDRGREGNIFLNLSIPLFKTTEEAIEWLNGEGQNYIAWVQQKQMENALMTQMALEDAGGQDVNFPSE